MLGTIHELVEEALSTRVIVTQANKDVLQGFEACQSQLGPAQHCPLTASSQQRCHLYDLKHPSEVVQQSLLLQEILEAFFVSQHVAVHFDD